MHGTAPLQDTAPEARRRMIVRQARNRFASKGYSGTKMELVAREAGVSTATLYALFSGKAELFEAVIDDAADDFANQMAGIGTLDGETRASLTEVGMAYADFMSDPFVRGVFRMVMAERTRFQPVALRFFERGRVVFGASLIGILERLSRAGELGTIAHPSWAAGHLMGMIEHPVFFVPLVTGDEVHVRRSNSQIVADAIETFLARYGT